LENVYEPEFVPVTMKMGDIVNIYEETRLRASPRHSGAGRFFSPFSNQSDDGAFKNRLPLRRVMRTTRRTSRNKKRMGVKGMLPLDCLLLWGREGVTLTDSLKF